MRNTRQRVMARRCDFCGAETTQFVITAKHLAFCNQGYIGKTTKYCLDDYLKQQKQKEYELYVRKKEDEKRRNEEAEKIKKEKEIAKPKLNKKLEEFYEQFGVSQSKRNYL